MKRKTFFSVLGALLILQSAAAQKAVLDTVYLQLNLDSVGLDEVVVKGQDTGSQQPLERYDSGGSGYGGRRQR